MMMMLRASSSRDRRVSKNCSISRGQASRHIEAVLLTAAFERLLNCRSGKEHDLANAVTSVLQPNQNVATSSCSLFQGDPHDGLRRCPTLREAWIRDFFRLRGTLAHGQVESRYSSVWILK